MLQLQCGRHGDFALESLTARIDRRRTLDSDRESRVHRERNSEPLQLTRHSESERRQQAKIAEEEGEKERERERKRERERMLKEESARSK